MKITDLIQEIETYAANGGIVYGVSIHGVGFEHRAGKHNIEEVIGDQFLIDGVKVTKELYNKVYQVIHPIWIQQGKQRKDRGLY